MIGAGEEERPTGPPPQVGSAASRWHGWGALDSDAPRNEARGLETKHAGWRGHAEQSVRARVARAALPCDECQHGIPRAQLS